MENKITNLVKSLNSEVSLVVSAYFLPPFHDSYCTKFSSRLAKGDITFAEK